MISMGVPTAFGHKNSSHLHHNEDDGDLYVELGVKFRRNRKKKKKRVRTTKSFLGTVRGV